MKKCFFLVVLMVLGASPTISGQVDHWRSLFDGETLEGWRVLGGFATYRVEEGAIVGRTVEGSPNTFLSTEGEFDDFELEFEVLCHPELNSGVQIRSHVHEKDATFTINGQERSAPAGTVYGYQVEITIQDRGKAGGIYDEKRRGWLDGLEDRPEAHEAFRDGEWNHYRVRAKGDRIQTWVNDIPCADLVDDADRSGFIGLQVHSVQGDPGYEVRWRNLRVRSLP